MFVRLGPQWAIDPTQGWFWAENWQRGEHEVDAQYAAGDFEVFDDAESFIADLEASVGLADTRGFREP